MIFCYVGKPRNGKSLKAMMRILWTLQNTKRYIVTNMVIDFDRVQDWCDARGLKIWARARIRILSTKEEMRHFWLYRDGMELARPADYDEPKGKGDVDYTVLFTDPRFFDGENSEGIPVQRGTLYVIDEIHTLYPARGWQGTPRHADFYCSQHGKLNDEIIFITQNTKLVDPNFYRLAQEFHYVRNHRLLKHGKFRGADKFVATIYEAPAATGKEPTMNTETFALDLEVACCYDTAAGVGMPGGTAADVGARAKGVPLWSVWAVLVVAIAFAWWAFGAVSEAGVRLANGVIENGTLSGEPMRVVGADAAASPAPAPSAEQAVKQVVPRREKGTSYLATEGGVTVVRYYVDGYSARVELSDGRILDQDSPRLGAIGHNWVEVDGERLLWRAAPSEFYRPPDPAPVVGSAGVESAAVAGAGSQPHVSPAWLSDPSRAVGAAALETVPTPPRG